MCQTIPFWPPRTPFSPPPRPSPGLACAVLLSACQPGICQVVAGELVGCCDGVLLSHAGGRGNLPVVRREREREEMKRKELEVYNQDSLPLSSPAQPAPSVPLFSPAACCGLSQISYREGGGGSGRKEGGKKGGE